MKGNQFDIGFAANQLIRELKGKDSVASADVTALRRNVYEFVKKTVGKIFERFPVGSVVVCTANAFDPAKMITKSSDLLHGKVKSLLMKLLNLKILTPSSCGKGLMEYKDFLRDDVKKFNDKFVSFDKKKNRLDEFFFTTMSVQKYKDLSFVLKIVLTLSDGQASVERSFSVNKSVLDVNMKEESMVARKVIRYHMSSNNLQPHTIEISKAMINSYKSARQKYEIYKEKQADKVDKKCERFTA